MRSSFGYSMLLHSRQKRKVICSWGVLEVLRAAVEGGEAPAVGEDMLSMKNGVVKGCLC